MICNNICNYTTTQCFPLNFIEVPKHCFDTKNYFWALLFNISSVKLLLRGYTQSVSHRLQVQQRRSRASIDKSYCSFFCKIYLEYSRILCSNSKSRDWECNRYNSSLGYEQDVVQRMKHISILLGDVALKSHTNTEILQVHTFRIKIIQ